MKRLLLLSGLALTGALAIAPGAQARADTTCNGTFKGRTIKGDLSVPSRGNCRLTNSTVRGDVKVRGGGYLQATDTTVRGDVNARRAETLFIDGGSNVKGNVEADRTSQVFLFDSAVGGGIEILRSDDRVNVCGMTVKGDIQVQKSDRDILIGDPLAVDCAGNLVKRGSIVVQDNFTDIELIVRGNTIRRGDLELKRNKGPSDKFVQNNVGGNVLACAGNDAQFTASGNTGWRKRSGQCAGR